MAHVIWQGLGGFNLRYRAEFPKARQAAQRALAIDERLGVAHAVLGNGPALVRLGLRRSNPRLRAGVAAESQRAVRA